MMAANSFSRKDTGTDEELIYDCDLLIIDDLGTELTNSFVSSQLFSVSMSGSCAGNPRSFPRI